MSHYYHIGTSRVVTTPHGGRTTTVIHVGEEREEIGRKEKERDRAGGERGEESRGRGRRGGEIILYFSYEPVRYVSSSVRQQCRVHAVDKRARAA